MGNLWSRMQVGLKGMFGKSGRGGSGTSGLERRAFDVGGSSIDWSSLTSDPGSNAAYLAGITFLTKSVNQAEPVVKRFFRDGTEEVMPDHPLLILLNRPNPYVDRQGLFAGVVYSLLTDGNAYIGIERDGDGVPRELCWLAPTRVSMCKEQFSNEAFDYWEYQQSNGGAVRVPKGDIVHLKYGIDPEDARFGLSPMRALRRQQYVLDQGVNYTANVLRNFGTVGAIITPSEPNTILDPKEIVDKYNAKTQGDRAGSVMAMDIPITIHYPKATPQDLALETLTDRSEADICAVLGVPSQVLGLHSGRLSKTYANMREAREIAWEETVLPLLKLIASGIGHALLPEFSESWQRYTLIFDVSHIRPLLPDEDAVRRRLREDWKAGLIDRATWKQSIGMKPKAEDEGVYYHETGASIHGANAEGGEHGGAQDTTA